MFSWTAHKKGPPKDCAAVAVRHKLYYFGNSTASDPLILNWDEDHIDVQVFNTVSLEWRKLPPVTSGRGQRPPEVPSSRQGHTAVLIGDIVYLW